MTEPAVTPVVEKAQCCKFNYCFWAKLIIAVPAIPLIAVMAASYFIDPLAQAVAGGAAAFAAIALAVVISRSPFMKRNINSKR